jgi:hypothetical protein
LAKSWGLREYGRLKFAWEVFNVTNSARFDVNPISFGTTLTTGNLGNYSALYTKPRVMQFSLRYDF